MQSNGMALVAFGDLNSKHCTFFNVRYEDDGAHVRLSHSLLLQPMHDLTEVRATNEGETPNRRCASHSLVCIAFR